MTIFQNGDFVQLNRNCKVVDASLDNVLKVEDCDTGVTFSIQGEDILSSINHTKCEHQTKVSHTELIQLLAQTKGHLFECRFIKENGEARAAKGYYLGPNKDYGRSHMMDLDKKDRGQDPHIQVDHRTLQYVIFGNVKYYS